jgi:hypothetical protein
VTWNTIWQIKSESFRKVYDVWLRVFDKGGFCNSLLYIQKSTEKRQYLEEIGLSKEDLIRLRDALNELELGEIE